MLDHRDLRDYKTDSATFMESIQGKANDHDSLLLKLVDEYQELSDEYEAAESKIVMLEDKVTELEETITELQEENDNLRDIIKD